MTTTLTKQPFGSEALTSGVRVTASPVYLPERSDPTGPAAGRGGRYVFGYRIRIANESEGSVQLISRHWLIVDAEGERSEVEGEGVVGQQPVLAPGQSFEYSSFCPLATPWGTMEGTFQFLDIADVPFTVQIARFYLVSPFAGPMPGQ
jgi:ApaG protein